MMKTNKVTKLGISLLSVAALGVVAPVLTDAPIFGATVVKAEERGSLNYRISYYDEETGEEIAAKKTGVINPGETINIYKDIDGYEVTTKSSRLPNYEATYDIVARNFHGDPDGYKGFHLDYKKLDADVKPSETPKPEVKPETKPSETPKPEVKPEPAPKAEEQKEPLKYRISYYDNEAGKILGQMTGIINPGETINIYKNIDGYEITFKEDWMPNYVLTWDIVNEYFYRSADGYDDLYLNYKKLAPTPGKDKDKENPKPEVKPETKPSETPKPEVKPETKPSDTPKPEVKPETEPSETPKPEVKPETKPLETPKPEVKPETKPSETSKPEVKPEIKPQTGSNNAPTAPINPVGQDSNTKADKPVSKTETTALPKTGEQNSILGFAGFLLASLDLAGLTYKGRH